MRELLLNWLIAYGQNWVASDELYNFRVQWNSDGNRRNYDSDVWTSNISEALRDRLIEYRLNTAHYRLSTKGIAFIDAPIEKDT